VRRTIFGLSIALLGAGCTPPHSIDASVLAQPITIQASASPFTQITAGQVRAMVPDGWEAVPAADADDARSGFLASPRPEALRRMDGSITGMSATWVDATRVGVPSDFYYLAATGPALSRLTHSDGCSPETQQILVDNRPSFGFGTDKDGDYMAQGQGTCNVRGTPTRWAYFVAAPGFGPMRRVGIPTSGLYVVVAVMRDSERAREVLPRLIRNTSFGGDSVPDLMKAMGSKRAR
jgi:hypothetical protein